MSLPAGKSIAAQANSSAHRIDKIVLARLRSEGIEPAEPAPDQVFLRRIHLDLLGSLPTADEAEAFLNDPRPEKRSALIESLLGRDEFALYRAMQWGDLLRIKAEFPINLWPVAARQYHRWLYECFKSNQPCDRMARELLTASGSNFRVGPANFFRAVASRDPESLARSVALVWMGSRIEKWPAHRREQIAVFFSRIGYKASGEWKEEIVFDDLDKPLPAFAVLPDGRKVRLDPGKDPRSAFADWLISPRNSYFARSVANRIWAWLIGRGIVDEVDDFRPDNPPSHPDLLNYLADQLIISGYDMVHLYRVILNSRTYQLSAKAKDLSDRSQRFFARAALRRLDAEVLIDALCTITGSGELYSSAVPEPYTIMPSDQRAIALPDASISNPFLELFGRSPRNTGLASERNNPVSDAQRLHLLNSRHIEDKIEQGPALQPMLNAKDGHWALNRLYLTILSRRPSAEELRIADEHFRRTGLNRRQTHIDVAWALLNSTEFLFRS